MQKIIGLVGYVNKTELIIKSHFSALFLFFSAVSVNLLTTESVIHINRLRLLISCFLIQRRSYGSWE